MSMNTGYDEARASDSQGYGRLLAGLEALLGEPEEDCTQLANAAALVFWGVEGLNWVGFYLMVDGELRLGPFHGRPACTRIPVGSGVCGTAAARREMVVVPDVHAFDGHIACDSSSNSEIVVPLLVRGELFGVFDIDSPAFDRFGEDEVAFFRRAGEVIAGALERGRHEKSA